MLRITTFLGEREFSVKKAEENYTQILIPL